MIAVVLELVSVAASLLPRVEGVDVFDQVTTFVPNVVALAGPAKPKVAITKTMAMRQNAREREERRDKCTKWSYEPGLHRETGLSKSRPIEKLPFNDAVAAVLIAIPRGEVLSYGEVAAEAGYPGAARAVGNLLQSTDLDLPWWRVVTADGRLVPGYESVHATRLRAEGVTVRNGRVPGMRSGGRRR